MGSDDFIDLCSPGVSDDGNENNGLYDPNSGSREVDFKLSASEVKVCIPNGEKVEQPEVEDDIPSKENLEQSEVCCGSEDKQHLQTMDLDSNLDPDRTNLKESIELAASVTTVDEMIEVKSGPGSENGGTVVLNDNTVCNDEIVVNRVKRARMTCDDQQPSVRVIYNSLTRGSKRKLEELMQQWSEWHAQKVSSSNDLSKEGLENGEETFFPALNVGPQKSSTVSFWMDFQGRIDQNKDVDSTPLYDRGYAAFGLASLDGSPNLDRGMEKFEASRCFNCGSYNHSLKECPKPRDNVAVNNARKQHNSKRNPTSGPRLPTRYYQNSPGGKFEGLRPGVLGAETRQCLGIGELDPPPWLNRMREIGYPPGYLDSDAQDQPSGITIFADEETKEEHEDGEILEAAEPEPPEKKKTIEFPGVNAPIPENADQRRWAASPGPTSSDSYRNRSHGRSNRPSDGSRGHYRDQRRSRDYRDVAPPGVDPRADHSMSSHGQRYGGYDSNYPIESLSPRGNNSIPISPSLGRSQSDRGWRGPLVHEGSPTHSPHGTLMHSSSSLTRHSPYNYSPAGFEDRAPESQHNSSSDLPSQRKDRHDSRYHHRK
ncbi:uncharacterized protein LOC131235597 isoform X2 [Magnolia sinica]|uniref:uncharacterized protein LOC131235597 isoform X2 n=1 Tax=Magnolia sinica TaxID=86752 RepID=UPI0026580140|nr:uncharacterized protein LOC131235597 isoform X2 [Magnolia sinica]